jgi:hypothetical protein
MMKKKLYYGKEEKYLAMSVLPLLNPQKSLMYTNEPNYEARDMKFYAIKSRLWLVS